MNDLLIELETQKQTNMNSRLASYRVTPRIELSGQWARSLHRIISSYSLVVNLLLLLLIIMTTSVQYHQCNQDGHENEKAARVRHEMNKLGNGCNKIKRINSVREMKELIDLLKYVVKNEADVGNDHQCTSWVFKRAYERCIEQREAIEDLEQMFEENHHVCSSKHLDKIEQYYETHIEQAKIKPLTGKFFFKYARQVAFACKIDLIKHSNRIMGNLGDDAAEKMLADEEIIVAITPEELQSAMSLFSQYHIKPCTQTETPFNEKLAKGAGIQCDETVCRRVKFELTDIDDLAMMLYSELNNPYVTSSSDPTNLDNSPAIQPTTDARTDSFLTIPDNEKLVSETLKICSKFKYAYNEFVMPVVRLAWLGVAPEVPDLVKRCSKTEAVKNWLSITMICEVLRKKHEDKSGKLDDGDDPEMLTVRDKVAQILEKPMKDTLWAHKYTPSQTEDLWARVDRCVRPTYKDHRHHRIAVMRGRLIKRWIARGCGASAVVLLGLIGSR